MGLGLTKNHFAGLQVRNAGQVFCNCSMFCCVLISVHSSFTIISMGKRELVPLLCLSSWCLVIVVWLFLTMPQICLQFVIVVFPDHTHLLFMVKLRINVSVNSIWILHIENFTYRMCLKSM